MPFLWLDVLTNILWPIIADNFGVVKTRPTRLRRGNRGESGPVAIEAIKRVVDMQTQHTLPFGDRTLLLLLGPRRKSSWFHDRR